MSTMKVKGSTLLSRRAMFAERIGADVYDEFVVDFAAAHRTFPQPMLATTLVPVDVFLAFNDELVHRFFGGDPKRIFADIGILSADYFSTTGPYVSLFARGDHMQIWSAMPTIWKNLYSEGEARIRSEGEWLDLELDCPVAHVYFEISTIAFVRHALELKSGRRVEMRRLSGFERGGKTVHYQFLVPSL
jgi:hypothetical protein